MFSPIDKHVVDAEVKSNHEVFADAGMGIVQEVFFVKVYLHGFSLRNF